MWEGNPVKYTAPDRQKTVVAPYEHTMLLIGDEPGKVYVVDAYTGWTQSYPLRTFMRSWKALGHMAITGGAPSPDATPAATLAPTIEISPSVYLPFILRQVASVQVEQEDPGTRKTYMVRRGDYLADVARRFGVNWRKLAKYNGIEYPYVIYTGQVLKIPQTGNPFAGDRALKSHPDYYTIQSGDTVNTIACAYGDVSPDMIALQNNLSSYTGLPDGEVLIIP
jgi:hypothetical protein